jgi:hypothetical protein
MSNEKEHAMTRHESNDGFNPMNIAAALLAKAVELVATMAPCWIPGEAHLVGAGVVAKVPRDGVDPLDLRLDALEREIARRRRG